MLHSARMALIVGIVTSLLGGSASAQSTWNGTNDALWSDGTNWSAGVPGAGVTAVFDNAGNGNTTLDLGAGVTVGNSLSFTLAGAAAYTIGSGGANNQSFTINDGGSVTLSSTVGNNQLIDATTVLGTTAGAATYTLTNNSTTRTLAIAGDLTGGTGGAAGAKTLAVANVAGGGINLSGAITNGGGSSLVLNKTGAGVLTLSGTTANTYTGLTTVTGNNGIFLILNKTPGVNAIGGNLTITPVSGGANARVQLAANEQISDTALLTLNGVSGAGQTSLDMNGFSETIGALTINNNQSSGGITQAIGVGTLTVNGNITIQGSSSGVNTISSGAAGSLNLGGLVRTIHTTSTGTAVISANIANGGINKTGGTLLQLSGKNTYNGITTLNAGNTQFVNRGALYDDTPANWTDTNIIVNSGATMTLNSGAAGFSSTNIAAISGLGTVGGGFQNGSFLGIDTTPGGLTHNNPITNANEIGLTKLGSNTLTLNSSLSDYKRRTAIFNGTLSVASLNSVVGGSPTSHLGAPTTVANGTIAVGTGSSGATLTYTGIGETTDRVINLSGTTGGATINQSGTGLLKFTSNFTATGNGVKTLTLGGATAGTGEIEGNIVNSANLTNVTKTGNGTWTLSGNNTYTGATNVNVGTLLINGNNSAATGAVNVALNAILGGSGIVGGAVTVNGTLAPGNSPDVQTYNAGLTFNAGSTFSVEILGPNVGNGTTGYDSAVVTAGNVVLDTTGLGVTLALPSPGGTGYSLGDKLWIIDNQGVGTLTGTFAGLPASNTQVTALDGLGGFNWFIYYDADKGTNSLTGGNDVVLTAVPEPGTWLLASLGLAGLYVARRRK